MQEIPYLLKKEPAAMAEDILMIQSISKRNTSLKSLWEELEKPHMKSALRMDAIMQRIPVYKMLVCRINEGTTYKARHA